MSTQIRVIHHPYRTPDEQQHAAQLLKMEIDDGWVCMCSHVKKGVRTVELYRDAPAPTLEETPILVELEENEPNSVVKLPLSLAWHTVEALMESPAITDRILSGSFIDAIRIYRQTRNEFLEAKTLIGVAKRYAALAKPTLPADVIDAYHKADLAGSFNEGYRILFQVVGKYMPVEAEGGNDA